jgi:hypothetical protein
MLQAFVQDTIRKQINSVLFLQQGCYSHLKQEDPANIPAP